MNFRIFATILLIAAAAALADTTYVATAKGHILINFPKLRAGDTLLIMPGDYTNFSALTTQADGTPDKRIVVRGATPNTVNITIYETFQIWVTVNNAYWTFENLNLDGGGQVNHAFKLNASPDAGGYHSSYVHVRNCKFKDFSETPVKAGAYYKDPSGNLIWFNQYWPADYLIWENNDNTGDKYGENGNGNGLNIDGAKNVIFRNCYYHYMRRNQALWGQSYATFSGFVKGGSYDCIFEGNVFDDVGRGICFGGGCMDPRGFRFDNTTLETRRCIARNNVVKNCESATYYCGTHDSIMIYNNTFINSGAVGGDIVVNNLVLGSGASASGGFTATNYTSTTVNTAWFWDPANDNYALKAAATPLVGQGTPRVTGADLNSVLTDILGTTRPNPPSIGAFEMYASKPDMDNVGIILNTVVESHRPYENNLGMAARVNMTVSPNPAAPVTQISFNVPEATDDLEVSVTDMQGRTLRNLYHGPKAAGQYSLAWDGVTHEGHRAAAGTYFVKYRSGIRQFVKRVVLFR